MSERDDETFDENGTVIDPNHRDFWGDTNFRQYADTYGEPASYGDWAPGVGEDPAALTHLPPRPVGDFSTLPFAEGVEKVD